MIVESIIMLMFLACVVGLFVGLIKPTLVIRWGREENKTRTNVLKVYGCGTVGIFIFIGVFGENLPDFFAYTLLASVVGLFVGLIKPTLAIRWGKEDKKTRKQVLKFYGIGVIASCILGPMSMESEGTQPVSGNSVVESEKDQEEIQVTEEEKAEAERLAKEAEEKAEEVEYELNAYKDFVAQLLDIYNMYEDVWMTSSINDLNKNQEFNESALETINTIATKLEVLPLTENQKKEFEEYKGQLEKAEERYAKFDEYMRYTLEAEDSFWDELMLSDQSMEEFALLKAEEYFANK